MLSVFYSSSERGGGLVVPPNFQETLWYQTTVVNYLVHSSREFSKTDTSSIFID